MNLTDIKFETLDDRPKGGQHVGVIPRGVKATHMPTGLVACCGTERSQMKNRDICVAMIEYGLAAAEITV